MTRQKTKRPTARRNRNKRSAQRTTRKHWFETLETRNLLAADFFENFDGFAGAGFQSGGGGGQLDSDFWAAVMGTTSVDFEGSSTVAALARGIATAAVGTNGLYAFDLDGNTDTPNDRLILIQPIGSVFNSADNGHLTLRIRNDSNSANSVTVNYDVFVRNDRDRSNDLLFSYSTDGVSFTPVPSATYTSPSAPDELGLVSVGTISALTDAGIAVGSNQYV